MLARHQHDTDAGQRKVAVRARVLVRKLESAIARGHLRRLPLFLLPLPLP